VSARIGLAFGLLLTAQAAFADDDVINSIKTKIESLDGPSSTSAGPSDLAKVTAQAGNNDSKAATQIARIWPIQSTNGAVTGAVMAAAPFSDSNTPKPDLGSVSNLTAGTNARLDAGWLFLPPVDGPAADKQFQAQNESICDDFLAGAVDDPAYFHQLIVKHITAKTYKPFATTSGTGCQSFAQGDTIQGVVQELNDEVKARNKALASGKVPEKPLMLKPDWQTSAKIADKKFNALSRQQPAVLQGLSVSLLGNQHSYSYVTTSAASKIIKQSTEGYGIGLNYLAVFDNFSVIAGYSYERPYKGGQGQQVCSPIGNSTSTSCSTAAVGAPVRTTARIVSGEARYLVSPELALGPRIEYDTVSANFGVKLPVYFVPDAKKTLTGGLQIGWTKLARYQGAVIIQKAFSFWH
jgi:hypothetical protein